MCFGSKPSTTTATPAPAPAAPLPPADKADIGESRREENIENFGQDTPSYRVRRSGSVPEVSPSGPITM